MGSLIQGNKSTKNRFYKFEGEGYTKYMDHGQHFSEENRWCFEVKINFKIKQIMF